MRAIVWRDYLCPWCYLGRDRTALMESLGVEVTPMSYELHPDVPMSGHPIRPGGRLDRVLDHVAAECEAAGLPMNKPRRSPNTRRVLELAELLRLHEPAAFVAFDDACYRAHWIEGRDLGDPDELRSLVRAAGANPDAADERLARGEGASALDASMTTAHDLGVTATPAWWVDERLLIPGAQPRSTVQRWITKLAERTDHGDGPGEATSSVT